MSLSETTKQDLKEKREVERLKSYFSVKIETSYLGRKIVLCKNISEGGICVEVSFNKFESPNTSIVFLRNEEIVINITLDGNHIKALGVVKWLKEITNTSPTDRCFGLGIEFTGISFEQKAKIRNYIYQIKSKNKSSQLLPTFPLLLYGQEVDTGIYEYQPYAEKYLTETSNTFFVIKNLKQGNLVANYNNFIYARYCMGNEKHFKEAIDSAYKASIVYTKFDIDRRAKIIVDIHKKLLKNKDKLIDLLVHEGHPRKLAEWEVSGMLKGTEPDTVHFYRMNLENAIDANSKEKIFIYRKPDGVVCLSTPKNAPCSISIIGVFALMAGNSIIVKPPLSLPISTIYFWKDIVYKSAIENGAPKGVVNIIIGNSKKIFNSWLNSSQVNDIIYIGNSKNGLELGKQIYASGKKPILELSGNDKVLIWKDAPLEESTNALLECFYGSSQICMVPKMSFVHQDIYDDFIKTFIPKVKELKPGLPKDPHTVLAPVGKIIEFKHVLEDALQKGGKLLCGSQRVNYMDLEDKKGNFIKPTVVSFSDSQISKKIKCLLNENFFPLLPIVRVSGKNDKEIFEKMLQYTNLDGFGLRISVWTSSDYYTDKFVSNIMPGGIVRINSSHIGFSSYLSNNGGTGKSGGPFGEMSYIWQKTTHLQGVSIAKL